jgi:hypothetical protein
MIGFDGRQRWRQHRPFKLCAKPAHRKIVNYFNSLFEMPGFADNGPPHLKFAIRSFLVHRTITMQG